MCRKMKKAIKTNKPTFVVNADSFLSLAINKNIEMRYTGKMNKYLKKFFFLYKRQSKQMFEEEIAQTMMYHVHSYNSLSNLLVL